MAPDRMVQSEPAVKGESIKSYKSRSVTINDLGSIENLNPNAPSPIRKSTRTSRKSSSNQPTLEQMFVRKRQRESEPSLSPEPPKKPLKDSLSLHAGDKNSDHNENENDIEKIGSPDNDVKHELDEIVEREVEEIMSCKNEDVAESAKSDIPRIEKMEMVRDDETCKGDDITDNEVEEIASNKNGDVTESDICNNEIKSEDDALPKESKIERCNLCNQNLNDPDLKYFYGHPQNAVEEYIALTDENLVLSSGDDGDIMERPHVNVTAYSIYDKEGHLVPIDGGLIESDVRIYLSGYLKSICAESSAVDSESVPVKDVGPIIEWSVHGFDGGQNNCIIISTEFGEYNLLKPSEEYSYQMNNLYERIRVSKVVVEYLEEFHYLLPTYEDLLAVINESTVPELNDKMMNEEMLHKHAKFVCEQVVGLNSEDDEPPLIALPCMRELIKLFGIKFGRTKIRNKIQYTRKPAQAWTKATTTPLVRKTFEMFFSNQLDKAEKNTVMRRKRCGICDNCQKPDCGECSSCKAMGKFGGTGKTKKACINRTCPNMAVEQAEQSDPENEDENELNDSAALTSTDDKVPINLASSNMKVITWSGECVKTEGNKMFYEAVKIDNLQVKNGDFVMLDTSSPSIPHLVSKIVCLWKETTSPNTGFFHGQIFRRASDTVLGEVCDPREIFLQDTCCSKAPLSSILRPAEVEKRVIPKNWFDLGGDDLTDELQEDNGKTYFYQKFYDKVYTRFEDLPADPPCPNPAREHRYCPSCERQGKKYAFFIPQVIEKSNDTPEELKKFNRYEWGAIRWKGSEYRRGSGVFLKPETFKLRNHSSNTEKVKSEKIDETIYTEHYRKCLISMRGSNADTTDPYCIGYISNIYARTSSTVVAPQDIYLKVNIIYRPENTKKEKSYCDDLNLVYWSSDEKEIPFSDVVEPCHLVYADNIPSATSLLEWSMQDYNRFYFKQSYDKSDGSFNQVPQEATAVGATEVVKIKAKGKGKGKSNKSENHYHEENMRPLRMLDVFAGCGGLSEGLHQSGAAISNWAIEQVTKAAKAYHLNNPDCSVFTDDCNKLLRSVLDGETHSSSGQRLPAKGDVELLCGGPPCQGFSGMNRFNSREYSNFKNSLVASFLSYCDYYRPKYFILENVRNFVAFKKGMVLKLTLRCLLQIGYQCTFGIVQAGNYGVPQTRRRLIIIASAPGFKLPNYPIPTHVFTKRACTLVVTIDGKRYNTNISWCNSAPRRTCTIRDAMSDLPEIPSGAIKTELDYGSSPQSEFQRIVRRKNGDAKLKDHICKNMAPLIQARICRIPTAPGSDWRDLPNVAVTLSDGTKSKVLQYWYNDIKNGRGPNEKLRGVCACANGGQCDPNDKQDNTLIPWCLPHTGNRHNHWAGLYGRVSWDGFFSTTVTDPEPMGKQGRVLHPEQNRVVSVRECARSQGFPDSYVFVGTIQDKHRQVGMYYCQRTFTQMWATYFNQLDFVLVFVFHIGNAVPPPLGAALGREIKKAFLLSTK